jgi:hypothetical protein
MTVMTFDGRTFEVDDEIASIVHALNAAGISTVASCSGHGMRPGRISLVDGRELFVLPSYEIGQWFETQFPRDINGQTATERAAVPPNASQQIERLQRAITGAMDLLSNGDTEGGARVLRECFWGTDAPCQDCKGERFVRFGNMRVECLKCNDPDSTAVTKSEQCPCWDSWRTNCQGLANCRAKQQGAPVETSAVCCCGVYCQDIGGGRCRYLPKREDPSYDR